MVALPVLEHETSTISSLSHTTEPQGPNPALRRPQSLRAFTSTEWTLIQAVLDPEGPANATQDDELSQIGPIPLTRRSLQTLTPGKWLNDAIVNAHILLYCNRESLKARLARVPNAFGHVFSSFFFPLLLQSHHSDPRIRGQYNFDRVRRWGNRAPSHNIFLLKTLLLPVNIDNLHWACVHVDFPNHTVTYLDSALNSPNAETYAATYTPATLRYLQDEHLYRVRQPFPTALWSIQERRPPQQDNGNDCGVFCCTLMDYILQDKEWDFDATHTAYLRYRMALTLTQQHLMD